MTKRFLALIILCGAIPAFTNTQKKQSKSQKSTESMQHSDDVSCVAYSPDGRHIITGASDGIISWDAHTMKSEKKYQYSATGPITYSPDGNHVAVGCKDDTLIIFNTLTGEQEKKVKVSGQLSRISYSANGKRIATCLGGKKIVEIWNTQTGALIQQCALQTDSLNAIALSPNGKYIVVASSDGASVLDVNTGMVKTKFTDDVTGGATYSSDGKQIIIVTNSGLIITFNADTGAEESRITNKLQMDWWVLLTCVFSPDKKYIAIHTSEDSRPLYLINAITGETEKSFGSLIRYCAYSPDSKKLIIIHFNNEYSLWNISAKKKEKNGSVGIKNPNSCY